MQVQHINSPEVSKLYSKVFLSQGWVYFRRKDLYSFYDEFFIEGSILRAYMKEHKKPMNRVWIVECLNVLRREMTQN